MLVGVSRVRKGLDAGTLWGRCPRQLRELSAPAAGGGVLDQRLWSLWSDPPLRGRLGLRALPDGEAGPRQRAAGCSRFLSPRRCSGTVALRLFRAARGAALSLRGAGCSIGARRKNLERIAEPEPGPHVLKTEVAKEESVDGPWIDPMVGRNSSTRHPRCFTSSAISIERSVGSCERRARLVSPRAQSPGSGTREARPGVCATTAAKVR